MTEISVVIHHVTKPYMTEISVGFTIVKPGSLDPGMYFDLEVKWLTFPKIGSMFFFFNVLFRPLSLDFRFFLI